MQGEQKSHLNHNLSGKVLHSVTTGQSSYSQYEQHPTKKDSFHTRLEQLQKLTEKNIKIANT